MVRTLLPATEPMSIWHERCAVPSMWIVQAPQRPAPQPYLVPVKPSPQEWGGRFGVPAFDRIRPEHFRPAFAHVFAAHTTEVAAIANNAAAPSFANTIAALEKSGDALSRTVNVFNLLAGAHNNDEILAIEREVAPLKAKHWDNIHMDAALFGRIERLYRARDQLALSAEERRVLERYYLKFVRAGAALDTVAKD